MEIEDTKKYIEKSLEKMKNDLEKSIKMFLSSMSADLKSFFGNKNKDDEMEKENGFAVVLHAEFNKRGFAFDCPSYKEFKSLEMAYTFASTLSYVLSEQVDILDLENDNLLESVLPWELKIQFGHPPQIPDNYLWES